MPLFGYIIDTYLDNDRFSILFTHDCYYFMETARYCIKKLIFFLFKKKFINKKLNYNK